jgi:predicted DNA-binding protein with PD1-like motif
MHHREVTTDREFVCRLETGADWRKEIESLAGEAEIDAGFFYGLGAVRDAEIWYYEQDEGEYSPVEFDEHLEVAACAGNVSLTPDGDRFAHTHAVLSRPDGETLAGHLHAGEVFAGELYLRAFEGSVERSHDPTTDLDLWF